MNCQGKYQILGVGDLSIDRSLLLPDYPIEDEKVRATDSILSVGGPVSNATIFLSRMGACCTYKAGVGDDGPGMVVRKTFLDESVNFIPHTYTKTEVNVIMINTRSGTRTILQDAIERSPVLDVAPSKIYTADLFVFDRHEPEAFDFVMHHKKPEAMVIVDTSTEISEKTLHMLDHCTLPIINVDIFAHIGKSDKSKLNIKRVYNKFEKPFIVTLGKQGALSYDGNSLIHTPTTDHESIDPNGAGDIFRAASGWGLLQKWNIHTIAQFASIVAGLHCTKYGNSTAIPTKQELEDACQKYGFDPNSIENLGSKQIELNDEELNTLLIPKKR